MNVDLSKYETVKERKKRFYAQYPMGRIIVKEVGNNVLEFAHFYCEIYRDNDNIIASTGNALELREKTKPLNKYGKEYESVNYTSWLENCEESAVGRALDNLGFSGNDKCSREEMQKVARIEEVKEILKAPCPQSKIDECIDKLSLSQNITELNNARTIVAEYALTPEQKMKLTGIYNTKKMEWEK